MIKISQNTANLLPQLALLLFAFSPLIENNDIWFYLTIATIVILFVLGTFLPVKDAEKDNKRYMSFLHKKIHHKLFDVAIGIMGLIVCYFAETHTHPFLWWLILGVALLELVFPAKADSENNE